MNNYFNPLVSVCVTVKNKEEFLDCCFNSIINQSYTNLEILVIYEQSSIDNSLSVINKYLLKDKRIKLITVASKESPGINIVKNVELAYNLATGFYICSVDADDYIELNCIKECVNNIKEFDLIYTKCRQFGDINMLDSRAKHMYTKEALLDFFMVFHFRLFKRSLWLKVKYLDCEYCWDYDLVLRMSEVGTFTFLPLVLYNWRRHKKQTTILSNKYNIGKNMKYVVLQAKKRRGLV